ncbi:MAG: uroporphyrinogen-III synthase [Muribaculaceae bacterium]|nr:uroporphyrinogen-III synthase [Muribaculaceae bacterium]
MKIKKILVSQPKPSSAKSPYYDVAEKYGVEVVFRPFIKIEGLTSKEFRQQKINVQDYSAVIFTARTAIDHYFRLCKELRFNVPDTMKYFCVSETVAHYLQKYIIYRKRKIFYSSTGLVDDLMPLIEKHKKEKYLFPVSDVHQESLPVLDQKNIPYTRAIMYRTLSNDFTPDEPFDYDMLIFFTPSGIKSLMSNFPNFNQGDIAIGCMGSKTIDEIKETGLRLDITVSPEAPSMAAAIDKYLEQRLKAEEKEAKTAVAKKKSSKPAAKTTGVSKAQVVKPSAK